MPGFRLGAETIKTLYPSLVLLIESAHSTSAEFFPLNGRRPRWTAVKHLMSVER